MMIRASEYAAHLERNLDYLNVIFEKYMYRSVYSTTQLINNFQLGLVYITAAKYDD